MIERTDTRKHSRLLPEQELGFCYEHISFAKSDRCYALPGSYRSTATSAAQAILSTYYTLLLSEMFL